MWCHEVAKPVPAAACNHICTDSFEIQAKRAYYDEEKSENGLRTSPYSLSHFAEPLYVAPSTTPSNAASHGRLKTTKKQKNYDGRLLKLASKELRGNLDVVSLAVRQNYHALWDAEVHPQPKE